MEQLTVHCGHAVALRRSNIDTDQIIPAQYCLTVTRTGFAKNLFGRWRQEDPDFVLNQPQHAVSTVLVAGPDFGTGSSREHAVWALQDFGFRVVVSSRFGDIFYNNSAKAGLLAARVDEPQVAELMDRLEANPDQEITVDVVHRRILHGEFTAEIHLDDFLRRRFLEALDDIALTLGHEDAIASYEADRDPALPALDHTGAST